MMMMMCTFILIKPPYTQNVFFIYSVTSIGRMSFSCAKCIYNCYTHKPTISIYKSSVFVNCKQIGLQIIQSDRLHELKHIK